MTAELSEDQRHISKSLLRYVVETQMSVSLSINNEYTVSKDCLVSNLEYNNLLKVVSGQ